MRATDWKAYWDIVQKKLNQPVYIPWNAALVSREHSTTLQTSKRTKHTKELKPNWPWASLPCIHCSETMEWFQQLWGKEKILNQVAIYMEGQREWHSQTFKELKNHSTVFPSWKKKECLKCKRLIYQKDKLKLRIHRWEICELWQTLERWIAIQHDGPKTQRFEVDEWILKWS